MNHKKCTKAFTLIELLTVIAIIGILAAILIPVVGNVKQRAQQSSGQNTLRQIGAAIQLYVVDNNGKLPGPLWTGQVAYYDSAETDNDGRLTGRLVSYLGFPAPSSGAAVEEFASPAFWSEVSPSEAATMTPYILNSSITLIDGGAAYAPFGNYARGGKPDTHSVAMNKIPADTWMLSDVDQQHPNVTGFMRTVSEPIYGNSRNVLYWDNSVRIVDVNDPL